ncbi:MAG: DUF448 domain-containing protein [Desulfuromonadaceae bacterium]
MSAVGHRPLRTCLGCRQARNPQDMVRFVLSPAHDLLVDYRTKLPGRGAYLCFNDVCLETAVKRRQFQRAFKNQDIQPAVAQLKSQLLQAITDKMVSLLGMARKSGVLISGSSMVLDALPSGRLALIVLANDVSDGIGKKVVGSAAARGVSCCYLLDKEGLGRMLGKAERSVLALKESALAESIKAEMLRYKQIAGEI